MRDGLSDAPERRFQDRPGSLRTITVYIPKPGRFHRGMVELAVRTPAIGMHIVVPAFGGVSPGTGILGIFGASPVLISDIRLI